MSKKNIKKIYIIGSLTNPKIPVIGNTLREAGYVVFDDWFAPGPDTDKYWQQYEIAKQNNYIDALNGRHAKHAFQFDYNNLEKADAAVMVLPCGKSGHLELGWVLGNNKPGHILLEQNIKKWDLMYRFATGVWFNIDDLLEALKENSGNIEPNG